MDDADRTRLRALCEDVALPLRAECTLSGYEIADANDEYIGDIETGHSDDDEWCDEVHADLIVGAVNALPALLDALDAAERERDEARAEVERLRASDASRRELMPAVLDAVRKVAREEEREACAMIATPYAARWPCAGDIVAKIRARGAGGGA